jgi:hypothetical protein
MASGLPSSGSGMTRRYPLLVLAISTVMAGLVPAIPIAWSAELLFIGITALDTLSRHGRACPGHPDQTSAALQSIGITGTGPVMTWERSERRGAFRIGITGTGPRIESGEMMKGDAIFRHSPYRHSRLYAAAGPARAALFMRP